MRVALVAGPDPGHAFPVVALALRLRDAGDRPLVLTGRRWVDVVRLLGVDAEPLPRLDPAGFDDADAGQRLHGRSAYMALGLVDLLRDVDVVVGDVLTAAGGLAAERLALPWAELSPHPLWLPSAGLPPVGSGLAAGRGPVGRTRDRLLRRMSAPAVRRGTEERAAARVGIGLPAEDPGPDVRLVACLPALEVPRPDWPESAYVVGPLLWDPATTDLAPPEGDGPLLFVSSSTATGHETDLLTLVGEALPGHRVVSTVLTGEVSRHGRVVVGPGRQPPLLRRADVAVIGAGHGVLAKALLAGTPAVVVPGGGDQREVAARAERTGAVVVVRRPDPATLRSAVERVLGDPSYARAARACAGSMAAVAADPVTLLHRLVRP